jgi:hypothetical protein
MSTLKAAIGFQGTANGFLTTVKSFLLFQTVMLWTQQKGRSVRELERVAE